MGESPPCCASGIAPVSNGRGPRDRRRRGLIRVPSRSSPSGAPVWSFIAWVAAAPGGVSERRGVRSVVRCRGARGGGWRRVRTAGARSSCVPVGSSCDSGLPRLRFTGRALPIPERAPARTFFSDDARFAIEGRRAASGRRRGEDRGRRIRARLLASFRCDLLSFVKGSAAAIMGTPRGQSKGPICGRFSRRSNAPPGRSGALRRRACPTRWSRRRPRDGSRIAPSRRAGRRDDSGTSPACPARRRSRRGR
jgi:hypothetical protein